MTTKKTLTDAYLAQFEELVRRHPKQESNRASYMRDIESARLGVVRKRIRTKLQTYQKGEVVLLWGNTAPSSEPPFTSTPCHRIWSMHSVCCTIVGVEYVSEVK